MHYLSGGGGREKFIYLQASKEVNLPVLRTKIVVSVKISLLVTELCTKWLQESTETSG